MSNNKLSYKLDPYEEETLEAVEKALDEGTLKSVADVKERLEEVRIIARNSLNKTKNINIRLTARDLMLLKRKAAEEGLPYQTLAASILHKYSNV